LHARVAAAAAAAGAVTGAGFAVRTADALDAPALFLPDIADCQADDQGHNRDDDKIFHNAAPFL